MKSEAEIYEAVARGWCHDANSAKEMDVLLGEAIAIEVLKVIRPLVAERDALAEQNERLREALAEDVEECAAWCDVDKGCLACYRFDTCKKRAALVGFAKEDLPQ